jgi:hypothetical protein
MNRRHVAVVIGCLAILGGHSGQVAGAATSRPVSEGLQRSVSSPLAPDYAIGQDLSVQLRICFNWSCSRRQVMTFSPGDMAQVEAQMALCPSNQFYSRLQRLRIGVWQMELLASKYQPLLENDLGINDFESGVEGRTDCVDNATNTTTYLHILQDLHALPGWSVSPPRVRSRFNYWEVHWTAVVKDVESGKAWSVDSWYRPNGHLPMVMTLPDWLHKQLGWVSPVDQLNPTPQFSYQLCGAPRPRTLSSIEQRPGSR